MVTLEDVYNVWLDFLQLFLCFMSFKLSHKTVLCLVTKWWAQGFGGGSVFKWTVHTG